MRKLFITVCELDEISYLPRGIDTEIFYAPLYEHAYRKIKDASNKLDLDVEFVRAATFPVKGATNELNPGFEDIVAVVSPLVFLAHAKCIENALNFVIKNDTAYATVGSPLGLFAAFGLGKMLTGAAIGSCSDFIHNISECGAVYKSIALAEGEKAVPVSRIDFFNRIEAYREELLDYLVMSGVDIDCRDGIIVSPNTEIRRGTKILTGTHICEWTKIHENCVIGPNAVLKASEIGEGCVVNQSEITSSTLEKNVTVGPYCVISDECHLLSGSVLQGYNSISNTTIGVDSRVMQQSCLKDTDVGTRVIIGNNVTTVSHFENEIRKCKLADDVTVGSGSNLIAPLSIGKGALIAAGSTITDNVPPFALAVAREFQENKDGWAKKKRKRV